MVPEALIVHRARGRVRLRIREEVDGPGYFSELSRKLEEIPGVTSVRINEHTRSVVLLHPNVPFTDLESRLNGSGLLAVATREDHPGPAITPLQRGISRINQAIAAGTTGRVDLQTLLFVVTVLIAVRQLLRGNIWPPAIAMLWYAMEFALRIHSGSGDGDG